MGFIDDVVVNAKSAAEMVGKTAGKIVDVSKLKINLAEINAEIKESYEALGKYVYENSRTLFSEDTEAVAKINAIDDFIAQAEAIKKDLMDKQNKLSCPKCGKLSGVGVSFCSECGTKLVEPPVAPAEEPAAPATDVTAETNDEHSAE